MRSQRLILCLALLALLLGASRAGPAQAGPPGPRGVLVGFRPGAAAQVLPALRSVAATSTTLRIPALSLYELSLPAGQAAGAVETLRGMPGVAFAELDQPAWALDAGPAAVTPNDPGWPQQWGLARIGAPAAWAVVTGTRAITIALVDTGIDLAHPDLQDKIWTNPGEIPRNGRDDDGDGKVDDVHGWRFYHDSWSGQALEDNRVQDDNGHGSHVAGIAGAQTDNGVGVAGLAWAATLLPVKALDATGSGLLSDIAAGIVYAADRGARVINVSAGGQTGLAALCAAVAYARDRGSLVVAAAGNDGGPLLYPAACPDALAVAATDRADRRAAFSNLGPQAGLAAPGVEIYSTWYASGIGASMFFTESGTSMAAPHVAGLAALVWTRWPGLSPAETVMQLAATADDVAAPGWDAGTGWGRINAGRAVAALAPPAADLWITLSAPARAWPGQPVTYTVTYGNRGWLPAGGSQITLTLPAILAAAPLTVALAALPPRSGPFQMTFSAGLPQSAPPGRLLATVQIAAPLPPLDPAAARAAAVTWSGTPAYLPALVRAP